MAKRLYKVVKITSDTTTQVFVVEADNPAAARNFIAQRDITVELASQRDLIELGKAGVEILIARPDNGGLDL